MTETLCCCKQEKKKKKRYWGFGINLHHWEFIAINYQKTVGKFDFLQINLSKSTLFLAYIQPIGDAEATPPTRRMNL